MIYQVSVKCKIENDKGKIQKITEKYPVNAVSVTDAEVKVTEKFKNVNFDWEVVSVSETKFVEYIP